MPNTLLEIIAERAVNRTRFLGKNMMCFPFHLWISLNVVPKYIYTCEIVEVRVLILKIVERKHMKL